jgi:NADH-quinone oxidoreductase subunit M
MFMMLASVGLPGTSGFVGEMLVLVGAWKASTWVAAFTATGLVLGATYMLWLYRRVMFGAVVSDEVRAMAPMNRREFMIFLPITVLVLWFGIYPASLLDLMAGSIQHVLDTVSSSGVLLVAQN